MLSKRLPGVKKCSEFQYHVADEQGREIRRPGFVRMRVHSREAGDNEDFFTADLLKRGKTWGAMCAACTYLKQLPTYHHRAGRKTDCPNTARAIAHHSLRVLQPKGALEEQLSVSNPAASLLKADALASYVALGKLKQKALGTANLAPDKQLLELVTLQSLKQTTLSKSDPAAAENAAQYAAEMNELVAKEFYAHLAKAMEKSAKSATAAAKAKETAARKAAAAAKKAYK